MDESKIMELMAEATRLELEGLEVMKEVSIDEACEEYNGIGPAYLPEKIRKTISEAAAIFESAAFIHDMQFYLSDGTQESFDLANIIFLRNCGRCAKDKYPWYSWKRYRALAIAQLMFDFVRSEAGWKAWQDAYEKI